MNNAWIDIYKLQYERIALHENERMRFSNVVIVITFAVLAYLSKLDATLPLNSYLNMVIALLLIAINLTAILFISKSRYWIKYHQKRAKVLLESNEKELFEAIYNVVKVDSDDDVFRRANLQKNLHIAIILICLIGAAIFIYQDFISKIGGA